MRSLRLVASAVLIWAAAMSVAPAIGQSGPNASPTRTGPTPSLPALSGPSGDDVWEATLANGLKVLMKEVRTAPLFLSSVWYRAGSRNEPVGATGMAHILEHMSFKGTAAVGKGEFDRILERNGAWNNASTWLDRTEYHIQISAAKADLALELQADMMRGALLTPEDLADEMTVVRNELEKGEDDPWNELDERLQSMAFLEHPYHWPVIGWKSDVESVDAGRLRAWYDGYYQPNNAYLVLVGDLLVEEMLAKAQRWFGGIPSASVPPPPHTVEPPQKGERRFEIRETGRARLLAVAWRVPQMDHPDRHALDLLARVLGEGRSSRLYRALVEPGLAASAEAANQGVMADPFLFHVWVEIADGADPARVEAAVHAEVERLRREPPSAQELDRVRQQARVELLFDRDRLRSVMREIGEAESAGSYRLADGYLDSLYAVPADRVRAVAESYLSRSNRTVGFYLPDDDPFTAAAAAPLLARVGAAGSAPRGAGDEGDEGVQDRAGRGSEEASARTGTVPPAADRSSDGAGHTDPSPDIAGRADRAPADADERNDAVADTLSNGIVVLVRESHENPTVAIRGFLAGGLLTEPAGKEGVASVTARALPLGAGPWTATELAERLESRGVRIDFHAEPDGISIRGRALATDFPLLVETLGAILLHPAFDPAQIEVARAQARVALDESLQDTYRLARRAALARIFGEGAPYARLTEGTEASLAGLAREDIVAYHRALLHGARWRFAVVGDVSAAETVARLSEALREVPAGSPLDVAALVPASEGARSDTLRLEVSDKSQLDIVLAERADGPSSPERVPGIVANTALGGAFTSRLNAELRDNLGFTYGADSFYEDRLGASWWIAATGVHPENLTPALRAMREQIDGFRETDPIGAEEFEKSIEYTVGSFPMSLESKDRMAEELLYAHRFGLGPRHISDYEARVRAVSLGAAREAAREFGVPSRGVVAIAGTFPKAGGDAAR